MKWLMVTAIALVSLRPAVGAEPVAKLIRVDKIWDKAPHSAFTDLIRWNDRFVCAFREGRGHASSDGRIRVLTSADGNAWQSSAVVTQEGYDLRDAGLSIAPDGRLMLLGGAAPREADNKVAPTGTFVSFSDDGATWTKPAIVIEPGRWLWRVTWSSTGTDADDPSRIQKIRGFAAYGVSYAAGAPDRSSSLLASEDGVRFQEVVSNLLDAGYPTEATLRFDGGTLYCLQRRDGKSPENTAMLGSSTPPYTTWQWHDLGIYFGGPNFLRLPSGQWIAAGRIAHNDGPKTELASLDVTAKRLTPILQLPSGGDTSYPGLVWHDDVLWVSYYSSHEGKTSIYLAQVRIE